MSHRALGPQFTEGESGVMSPHELTKYWDPNMGDPEKTRHWAGKGYLEGLAGDIKEHGMRNPVQLKAGRHAYIYDGHHRTLVALDLGMKEVPYEVVSGKPGEQ